MEIKEMLQVYADAVNDLQMADKMLRDADMTKKLAQHHLAEAERVIEDYYNETGETKIDMDVFYYGFSYSTPRKSIDCPDVDAVPDEFVRIKREPDKRKIGDYLKTCDSLPNWAVEKEGESKFQIKVLKKGAHR